MYTHMYVCVHMYAYMWLLSHIHAYIFKNKNKLTRITKNTPKIECKQKIIEPDCIEHVNSEKKKKDPIPIAVEHHTLTVRAQGLQEELQKCLER